MPLFPGHHVISQKGYVGSKQKLPLVPNKAAIFQVVYQPEKRQSFFYALKFDKFWDACCKNYIKWKTKIQENMCVAFWGKNGGKPR